MKKNFKATHFLNDNIVKEDIKIGKFDSWQERSYS